MRSTRILKQLRHYVGDVLSVASLSDTQMLQALFNTINGNATFKQALTAALSVARERQSDRIIELEHELKDAEFDRNVLEGDLRDLRRKLDALIAMHTHEGGRP
jgi:hypothetical protein